MPAERLQKILARAGYGSRRSAEALIAAGRVAVDGDVATLGMQADPNKSTITVDGKQLSGVIPTAEVWMLHKPRGYVVSVSDERRRPTVYRLLHEAPAGLRYVGRLDIDTEGLLLLSTDGELVHRLTHPRYEVWKTYEAEVEGEPDRHALQRLRDGVLLDDGLTAPARVEVMRRGPHARVRLAIREGRKREVRRMLVAVGHPVTYLVRMAVGDVRLGDLPVGQTRRLTAAEEESLRRLVGLVDAQEEASI